MNEKGFASLTALAILLILAYLIRGTDYTAGLFVEMTNNFETENRLKLVAESRLANKIERFTSKALTVAERTAALVDEHGALDGDINFLVKAEPLNGRLYFRQSDKTSEPFTGILITAYVKRENYFAEDINAFSSAGAFLSEAEETDDDGNKFYKYSFKGYLHKGL